MGKVMLVGVKNKGNMHGYRLKYNQLSG